MQITNRNSFKVKPIEVKFSESTSGKTGKRVVICSIIAEIEQPTVNGVVLLSPDYNDGNPWHRQIVHVTAKAVCTEGDTYSKEIGEKVAQAKAESKLYFAVNKRIQSYLDDVKIAFDSMSFDFAKKTSRVVSHNQMYIDRITGKTA